MSPILSVISIVIISNVAVSMLRLACKGLPGSNVPAYLTYNTKKRSIIALGTKCPRSMLHLMQSRGQMSSWIWFS